MVLINRFIILLMGFALVTGVAADDQPAPTPGSSDRPRVGLVLGGGGARGASHIGVIQVLEELQIPVDFVVGTSMGSIVGGLYAAGYSPDEMAAVVAEADWSSIMSDQPPRDQLWYRRRQDERRFQVDLELGWKDGGPALPPGLILGRNIDTFLEQLLLPVAATRDFDELPIPYRCVGIDIADGQPVVFDGGKLSKAIRASISLPGIFAPVEYDGSIVVDGGFVDNIPVGVAREMGADVLIVVDVATPIADPETRRSLVGVYDQVIRVMMDANRKLSLESLRDSDIAMRPELGSFSSMDFAHADSTISAGREAAEEAREQLAVLSVDDDRWQAWLAKRQAPVEAATVRKLELDLQTRLSPRVIREFTAIEPGEPLDAAALEQTREELAGLGAFERIEIDIAAVPGEPSERDVILRPIEKDWGPNYLRFGLGLSSDLQGGGEFDVGIQHTWTPMNGYNGEWRNEVQVGSRTRLYSEFYQPIDPALRWFVVPSVEYQQDILPLISDGDKIAEVNVQAMQLGVALGRNLGFWGELRSGYYWFTGTAKPEVAVPGLLPESIDVEGGSIITDLSLDTVDSISFPRRGLVGNLGWEYGSDALGNDRTNSIVDAVFGAPISFGAMTLFPRIEGGQTLQGNALVGGEFLLGGFQRLSGLQPREIAGNNYALGVLDTHIQLSQRTSMFSLATYIGATLELGGVWQDRDEFARQDMLLSGSIYVGADSFIGPAYLALGFTQGGHNAIYVFIGPTF